MPKRVVITSAGVVSSLGNTLEQITSNFKNGKSVFKRPSFDDQVVMSPVEGFNIKEFTGRFKDARYLNRGSAFSVAAAMDAVKNAGITSNMISKAGLFVGNGPNLDIDGEVPRITDGRMEDKGLMALWILRFLPNTAASAISKLAGIHGENATIGTACSASLQAIGEGYRKIKHGYLDLAFTGGGDSRLSYGGILSYKMARALFTGDGDEKKASRPFDGKRKGFVPGEGGAFFLIEELEHAKSRGAQILAEVCGFGASIDGYNMTAPDTKGRWAEFAVRSALDEAGMQPFQIDAVSAHGTGTLLNDEMEAALIDRIYKEHKPHIIALKSWIGHLASACGAVELAICLGCIKSGFLPKVRNLKDPCHKELNFAGETKDGSLATMVLENFGFGGQNSALVIKRWSR
jgi:3-oxoacyl-[acyl-carrier-protein] synthase II